MLRDAAKEFISKLGEWMGAAKLPEQIEERRTNLLGITSGAHYERWSKASADELRLEIAKLYSEIQRLELDNRHLREGEELSQLRALGRNLRAEVEQLKKDRSSLERENARLRKIIIDGSAEVQTSVRKSVRKSASKRSNIAHQNLAAKSKSPSSGKRKRRIPQKRG